MGAMTEKQKGALQRLEERDPTPVAVKAPSLPLKYSGPS